MIGGTCAHSNPLKANYTFAKCKSAETKSKKKRAEKAGMEKNSDFFRHVSEALVNSL